LFNYASPSIVHHLYFAAPAGNYNLGGYERLGKWANINFQLKGFEPFLASHNRFLLYGSHQDKDPRALRAIAGAGYRLVSAEEDAMGVLYEYAK